ncbi:hypothetical protein GE061_014943 [Apolygus lucorum]|uniref:Elongator complex protein 2 n=1 Tax=Apolygus lucorum TaxID=248454 RepID=A0A6A4JMT9_APOLU|nr:hypothetical protein GE061_014943 [Apolygus lucorum]
MDGMVMDFGASSFQPVELSYVSSGVNLTPRTLDWQCSNNLIAYGSHSSVHLYRPQTHGDGGKVVQTLCGHKGRVNAVRWLNAVGESDSVLPEFVTASSDSTVRVWSRIDGLFVNTSTIKGHEGAVNDVTGLFMSESNAMALVASSASDFTIKLWKRCEFGGNFSLVDSINLKNSLCVSLEATLLPGIGLDTALLAISTETTSIQLYSVNICNKGGDSVNKLTSLVGHEDWVRGLSFTPIGAHADMFLASSSQDGSVRVWKISLDESTDPLSDVELPVPEFKMEKKSFSLGSKSFSVALETVLLGHEGWIYAAKWFPTSKGSNLQLMTFSFDHTIILWSPDEETGVWFEKARLGNVGGEALGFLGGAVGPQGLSVVAHTHQGSLNLWHFSSEENRWCPKPICCGHFDEVTDLAWEPNGHFLLSQGAWYEMARPQIHGYGMNSIATLPDFKFVSAADEKIARAFGAPRNTLENLRTLSGVSVNDELLETSSEPMGATVPALGLSNKAVFTEETETNKTKRVQGEDDTSYFTRQLLKEPPTDDFLSQNSLWPETMKLYGHGYDVYSVAASHNGRFVATACKATAAEHARIILWNTDNWEKVHDFDGSGHSLTVTQMSFSPDDSFLLSVSRDRNWTVHGADEGAASYRLLASSDKKTGVHSRIIWSCCWSHDSALFATSSREGVCAVWSSDHLRDAQTKGGVAVATKDWLADCFLFKLANRSIFWQSELSLEQFISHHLLPDLQTRGLFYRQSKTCILEPFRGSPSVQNTHQGVTTQMS